MTKDQKTVTLTLREVKVIREKLHRLTEANRTGQNGTRRNYNDLRTIGMHLSRAERRGSEQYRRAPLRTDTSETVQPLLF